MPKAFFLVNSAEHLRSREHEYAAVVNWDLNGMKLNSELKPKHLSSSKPCLVIKNVNIGSVNDMAISLPKLGPDAALKVANLESEGYRYEGKTENMLVFSRPTGPWSRSVQDRNNAVRRTAKLFVMSVVGVFLVIEVPYLYLSW